MLCMANKDIPESVRRWYRRIGAKGGQAGKGTELRKEIMRNNARKRWAAVKKAKANDKAELRKIFVGVPRTVPDMPKVGFK